MLSSSCTFASWSVASTVKNALWYLLQSFWCSSAHQVHAGVLFSKKIAKKEDVHLFQTSNCGVKLHFHSCKMCFVRVTKKKEWRLVFSLCLVFDLPRCIYYQKYLRQFLFEKEQKTCSWQQLSYSISDSEVCCMPKLRVQSYGLDTAVFITAVFLMLAD